MSAEGVNDVTPETLALFAQTAADLSATTAQSYERVYRTLLAACGLLTERDRLKAQVAAVEALADSYGGPDPIALSWARAIHAALASTAGGAGE